MDPQEEAPRRSSFWFNQKSQTTLTSPIFDQITIVVTVMLALTSFIIYWPMISQIDFEEAFYTPLVPYLMATLANFGIVPSDALRMLFVTSLSISTVGLYLLMRDLTKRQVTAILAAIIYLIPPMPIFVLTILGPGILEKELISAKSFFTIVYGDGAHFVALALVPFALLFFLRYLKFNGRFHFAAAVVTCSLILLANRSQGVSLAIVLVAATVTSAILGLARVKLRRLFLVVAFSLGLVSFWYTGDFWASSLVVLAGHIADNIQFIFPLPLVVSIFGLFFSFVFFAKREDRQPIFMAFLVFIVFLSLMVGWLASGRSIMPHPHRLVPNLNMFGAIVAALSLSSVIDKLEFTRRLAFDRWSAILRVIGAILFAGVSFATLTVVTYVISPLLILALADPSGIWTKIRLNVIADRQETLNIAGENFKLIGQGASSMWHLWFGAGLSLIFVVLLILLIMRDSNNFDK